LRLKARAELALGRESAALETLKRLRAEHPKTEAAISSYLNEAEHYAVQDKISDARRVLIALTDNPDPDYRTSTHAQYALFRLALLSERLGSEENLREANRRIEELIELSAKNGADQDLIFEARLKQGEVFSKRNDFPAAQRAYEYLVNTHARRPDVVYAQLALAKTHNAQSASDQDRTHTTQARLLFEQLRDRVDAPIDVRVEAGYNLGALLAREGKAAEAARVWWNDVVSPFLLDRAPPGDRDAKRLYWLARTLLDLGDLEEKRGNLEEAKRAHLLVLEKKLPYGDAIARGRLQQLGVTPAKAGP
jgi:tetratricopeptide (TPR) repeat protein